MQGANIALTPSARVIMSYSELFAQDQPERASLSVPARFPAHQMDAPLLESLEGSVSFVLIGGLKPPPMVGFSLARAAERECWGCPPGPSMNIKHTTITAFRPIIFLSAGKVVILTR